MEPKIPVPVTFNAYKHHFGFLKSKIKSWKTTNPEKIKENLLVMGENLIDLYTGELPVETICSECLSFLQKEKLTDKDKFIQWLYPFEYRKIELGDSSLWVIREGIDPERYVHIHPAKYSPFTLRVRAATLKTVTALEIGSVPLTAELNENLRAVNETRISVFQLSPVKSLHPGKGILFLWKFFHED